MHAQVQDVGEDLEQNKAEQTLQKQHEVTELWTQLTAKANSRKEKLFDSYDLQRFLKDHRDLLAWINSMLGLVSSEELANYVTGAEGLIERPQKNPRDTAPGGLIVETLNNLLAFGNTIEMLKKQARSCGQQEPEEHGDGELGEE
ncbi:unnamed protein product [Ceutorhynchus assimilis]|uniref:Uncharacterized protein n=1 Tax=Ceutorhynchus assimilis TaxID=467358 RepID=A0A9N9QSK8_9CUCU|nr:unnamed protein product [Ceutorhynchus assimilis]